MIEAVSLVGLRTPLITAEQPDGFAGFDDGERDVLTYRASELLWPASAGSEWAVPHSFRRTMATPIDQAGLEVTEAASVLDQHPHTTSRYYVSKRGDARRAASVP